VINANYAPAWEALRTRFENKKLVTHAHLKAIVTEPAISSESASGIRKVVDRVNQHIRSLEAFGEPSADTILTFLLCEKLDSITRREWELIPDDQKRGETEFKKLTEFLYRRAQAL